MPTRSTLGGAKNCVSIASRTLAAPLDGNCRPPVARRRNRWRLALHLLLATAAVYLVYRLCLYVALRDSRFLLTLFMAHGGRL